MSDNKFLGNGRISIIGVDSNKRKVIYEIEMPYILMISITPSLLYGGKIDEFRIPDSLSVWQQNLNNQDFNQSAVKNCSDIDDRTFEVIENKINEVLKLFIEISQVMKNPSSIMNMLPMGTYISFKYICDIDKIPHILESLQQNIQVNGVAEFQFSFGATLDETLRLIRKDSLS